MRGTDLISPQPTQFSILVGFSFEAHFALSPSVTTLISTDFEFYCTPTLTHVKNKISIKGFQEIRSVL